ncbi:hypothetical protein FQZ97_1021490 [compost metagenome]
MADIVITAASVLAASDATTEHGRAGATITAGQVVALETTSGKLVLADADGSQIIRRPRGIALNGASDGQPLAIAKSGDVTLAGMTAGVSYFLSPTPGGIAPRADVLTGDYVTHLGIAKSATVLALDIQYSGTVSA